jgi:hypothetical protein
MNSDVAAGRSCPPVVAIHLVTLTYRTSDASTPIFLWGGGVHLARGQARDAVLGDGVASEHSPGEIGCLVLVLTPSMWRGAKG